MIVFWQASDGKPHVQIIETSRMLAPVLRPIFAKWSLLVIHAPIDAPKILYANSISAVSHGCSAIFSWIPSDLAIGIGMNWLLMWKNWYIHDWKCCSLPREAVCGSIGGSFFQDLYLEADPPMSLERTGDNRQGLDEGWQFAEGYRGQNAAA